jgi:regulator of protease activity HflC (stomatin/prohibitin superfamily)
MDTAVRLFVEMCQLLWPFRIVKEWQRGGYMVCGKWWKEVGPGCYVVIPWFFDVQEVSMAGSRVGTGRQDLTLLDGSTLSFAATAWVQVREPKAAICDVDDYQATAQEDLTAILAGELAELDPDRLRPRRRGTLFKELETAVAKQHAKYGVESSQLAFSSFVLGAKMHRLLIDQHTPPQW